MTLVIRNDYLWMVIPLSITICSYNISCSMVICHVIISSAYYLYGGRSVYCVHQPHHIYLVVVANSQLYAVAHRRDIHWPSVSYLQRYMMTLVLSDISPFIPLGKPITSVVGITLVTIAVWYREGPCWLKLMRLQPDVRHISCSWSRWYTNVQCISLSLDNNRKTI